MKHDFLNEPLLTFLDETGNKQRRSLPGLMVALQAEDVFSFPHLRPHQTHPLHAFLVQLAAMILSENNEPTFPTEETVWRRWLLAMSKGEPAAWCLCVDELSKPAFFQTPIPEENLKRYKKSFSYPDELDLLVTSKNHDVKRMLIRDPRPEHVFFALMTMQTFGGYEGPGIQQVMRMNGGYGSRPCVALAPSSGGWGARWKRDVRVLLDARTDLIDEYGYQDAGGHRLLWLLPWEGEDALALQECDPYVIEIARRVRVTEQEGALRMHRASTKATRLDAKALNGVTGDPWTPISNKDAKALSVSENGFTYAKIDEILFNSDWRLGVAGRPRDDDPDDSEFVLQCLARGQGGTGGYHERRIPARRAIQDMFASPAERERLAELSQFQIAVADAARRKVLHPALCVLMQAGPPKLNLKDRRDQSALNELEAAIDADFFPYLWSGALNEDEGAAQRAWIKQVRQHVRAVFERALNAVPIPAARQPRAIAKAELMFFACRKKHLPLQHVEEVSL